MMTPKTRFLNACMGAPVDRPPVWMMRQAGRYLPEYRAIRKAHSTLTMMKTPSIACEITLQPVELMGVDAAILYSDILMVPDAMGLGLNFEEGRGPVFARRVKEKADVDFLSIENTVDRTDYVFKTIELIKTQLSPDYPLLGFAGAPFTVASYMVEEGAEGLKKLLFADRGLVHALLEKVTLATIDYLSAQVKAGVDAVQLFDTWAGELSAGDFAEFAFPYQKRVIEAVNALQVPTILYIKNGSPFLEQMVETGVKIVSLDWRISIPEAIRRTGGRVALQGNLDPMALYAPEEEIVRRTKAMLQSAKGAPGYIANLGHGILPDIPVSHAKAFIETVKNF